MRVENKIVLYLTAITLLWGCNIKYVIKHDHIKSEWPFNRGFELAQLSVDSLSNKSKYPIKYTKNEVFICLVYFDEFKNIDHFKYDHHDLTSFWVEQNAFDNANGNYFSNRNISSRKIYFDKEQMNVKWLKFPFQKENLISVLPMKLQNKTWYKLSHFFPEHYDIEYSIYLYIENKQKIHSYHFWE